MLQKLNALQDARQDYFFSDFTALFFFYFIHLVNVCGVRYILQLAGEIRRQPVQINFLFTMGVLGMELMSLG